MPKPSSKRPSRARPRPSKCPRPSPKSHPCPPPSRSPPHPKLRRRRQKRKSTSRRRSQRSMMRRAAADGRRRPRAAKQFGVGAAVRAAAVPAGAAIGAGKKWPVRSRWSRRRKRQRDDARGPIRMMIMTAGDKDFSHFFVLFVV